MPSPETIVQAGKLIAAGLEEALPEAAGAAGRRQLNLLGIVDEVPGLSKLETLGNPGDLMPVRTGAIASNFPGAEGSVYQTNQQLAAYRALELEKSPFARTPSGRLVTVDSLTEPGRTLTLIRPRIAQVARLPLPTRMADGVMTGTGTVVRADGLMATSQHTLRSAPTGDIFVKYFGHPGSVKASIVAEDPANDLALLKPTRPLTAPVQFFPTTMMVDNSAVGTRAVSVGFPNLLADMTGRFTGEAHFAQGQVLDRGMVSYMGAKPANMYWTNIPGEFGMSGGPTFELGTNRLIGALNEGRDYSNSALIPAEKLRRLIARV